MFQIRQKARCTDHLSGTIQAHVPQWCLAYIATLRDVVSLVIESTFMEILRLVLFLCGRNDVVPWQGLKKSHQPSGLRCFRAKVLGQGASNFSQPPLGRGLPLPLPPTRVFFLGCRGMSEAHFAIFLRLNF